MSSNPQLELAHHFIEQTNKHVFLTGKAGTGKTTFLHRLQEQSPKRMVVVAHTGVAAINAKGVTIHSFFQMPFGPHLPEEALRGRESQFASGHTKIAKNKINIIRSLDLLVIDEISMVRADLLDGIDQVLRRYRYSNKPFGGVQLLMIGDIRQLSPIIKDEERHLLSPYYNTFYFYGSRALQQTDYISIELQHIYRQSDSKFISILNKIRENAIDASTLQELNKRYQPDFKTQDGDGYIQLTTHNAKANQVNQGKLEALKETSHRFMARVHNDFPEYLYPTEQELELKVNAQVMFIKNDPEPEKLFYNGKIGIIEFIDEKEERISVRCPEDKSLITVGRLAWDNTKYTLNNTTKEIEENVVGKFEQIPLKLAWAITIHKSQGLTFEKAIIDAQRSFAHGQVYVALSRCRNLDGLVLNSPIESSSIKTDANVTQFAEQVEKNPPDEQRLTKARIDFQRELLEELFNFKLIAYSISTLRKHVSNFRSSLLTDNLEALTTLQQAAGTEIVNIAEKFKTQLYHLFAAYEQEDGPQKLQDRLAKASVYFLEKIQTILLDKFDKLSFETDNKQVEKDLQKPLTTIYQELEVKKACFELCQKQFDVPTFLDVRAKASIQEEKASSRTKKKDNVAPESVKHPELYNRLRAWRNDLASDAGVPVYRIIQQTAMAGIANSLPTSADQLQKIKGMGKKKIKEHGEEILTLIAVYCQEKDIAYTPNLNINFETTKQPKQDTKLLSFNLFKEGNSIDEISTMRQLTKTTIESHLAHFIENGELPVEQLVPEKDVEEILETFQKNDSPQLTQLKEMLHDKYDYGELKMVMAHARQLNN